MAGGFEFRRRIKDGEGKPLPPLEIAKRTLQVVPAITGLIDRLEKQKLVARRRCTDDRRVLYLEISARALEVLQRVNEPLEQLHRELLGRLSKKDLKT